MGGDWRSLAESAAPRRGVSQPPLFLLFAASHKSRACAVKMTGEAGKSGAQAT